MTGPESHLAAAVAAVKIAGHVPIVARLERDAVSFFSHEIRKIIHVSVFAKP